MIKKSIKKFFTMSFSLLTICTLNSYSSAMESEENFTQTAIGLFDRNKLKGTKEGKTLLFKVLLKRLEKKSKRQSDNESEYEYAILDSDNSVVNCPICLEPLRAGQRAFVCACEDVFNPSGNYTSKDDLSIAQNAAFMRIINHSFHNECFQEWLKNFHEDRLSSPTYVFPLLFNAFLGNHNEVKKLKDTHICPSCKKEVTDYYCLLILDPKKLTKDSTK